MTRKLSVRMAAILYVLFGASVSHAQDTDWPFLRHDLQLTGRSPAVGSMTEAPVERWRYYLGGWKNEFSVTFAAGTAAHLPILNGNDAKLRPNPLVWHTPKLVDLLGTGALVPAPSGKVAKLLPNANGLQQVIFEHPPGKPTVGVGRCYSFENGPDKPRLVWQTEQESEVYELLWTIADLDGDALPEVVFMTHYRVLVYDGQTGEKKSTLKWPIGRNYGQMTLADVDGDALPEVVVTADAPAHVDVLKYAPEQGTAMWSHRYVTDAQVSLPIPLKVHLIPNSVQDLDGDGRMEIVYNRFNADGDFRWHVVMRDALTGRQKHDLPGLVLWGIVDLGEKRKAMCCIEAPTRTLADSGDARLILSKQGAWTTLWRADRAAWQMEAYDWPLTAFSIAAQGPFAQSVPRVLDVDGDGRNEVFATREARTVEAIGIDDAGRVTTKWSFDAPAGSRPTVQGTSLKRRAALVNVDAESGAVRLRDCQAEQVGYGLRSSFAPLPSRSLAMVVDVEGDGTNEVVVQDAHWQTRVLRFAPGAQEPREVLRVRGGGLWLGRLWAGFPYSKFPVFTHDLDDDGDRELLLTDVGDDPVSSVTCRDHHGQVVWKQSLPDTPAQSVVWMAAGHFSDPRRTDLLVVVQSGAIGECFCLHGAAGEILWRMGELQLADGTPFNFGSHTPYLAVADFDGDGLDDLCGQSGQYVALVRGSDGTPIVTPRSMIDDLFPRWVNYGVNVVGDWDRTGQMSMFTNTTTNGFGLIDASLRVKWFTDREGQPLVRPGSIGRADNDGPWVFGTLAGNTFMTFDMTTGELILSESLGGDVPAATSEVVCADVDGDGSDEFLAAANDLLLCMRSDRGPDPRLKWKLRLPTLPSELAVADADNDGLAEILYTGTDGYLHCLGARGP